MVHFLRNKNVTIIMVLALLLVSVYSIISFKLNLGASFYDSTALVIELNETRNTDNVKAEVANLVPVSAIEKEGLATYHIYFQNLTLADKAKLDSNLSQLFPALISSTYSDYQPIREQLLEERILIVTSILAFMAMIYAVFKIKKVGLTRLEAINFILNELVIVAFMFIVLGGFIALSGQLGLIMDFPYFTLTLLALFLILAFELYYLIKFQVTAFEQKKYDLTQIESKITASYWPEFMFLISISLIVFFVPWLVINSTLALASIQILVALLLSAYSFFILRAHFNKIELINLPVIKKWKFLHRNW
jgi:hypothetical protein